jgi:hypothetical protein
MLQFPKRHFPFFQSMAASLAVTPADVVSSTRGDNHGGASEDVDENEADEADARLRTLLLPWLPILHIVDIIVQEFRPLVYIDADLLESFAELWDSLSRVGQRCGRNETYYTCHCYVCERDQFQLCCGGFESCRDECSKPFDVGYLPTIEQLCEWGYLQYAEPWKVNGRCCRFCKCWRVPRTRCF